MNSTPLDKISEDLSSSGIDVQFKRKLADGSLINADLNQISLLKSKASIATVAQAIAKAPDEEKTLWALELKDYANELYRNGMIREAMDKYLECMVATNFGSNEPGESLELLHQSSNSNIDSLVVPVLCNLAACCMQLHEWSKGATFCKEALALRPNCPKALMRFGICLFHIGEYELSKENLILAQATPTVSDETDCKDPIASMQLKVADKARITLGLNKVNKAIDSQNKALEYQRRAMVAAFSKKDKKSTSEKSELLSAANLSIPAIDLSAKPSNENFHKIFRFIESIVASIATIFDSALNWFFDVFFRLNRSKRLRSE